MIALKDNCELTFLCRLRDFFKDEIDLCSYSLLLVNSIFCRELHFILLFHMYAQIYIAAGINNTFLQVLPSKVFITIWVTKWGQVFWVVNSISISVSGSIICVVPFEGPLHLSAPVPYMSQPIGWGVRLHLCRGQSSPVLFIPIST